MWSSTFKVTKAFWSWTNNNFIQSLTLCLHLQVSHRYSSPQFTNYLSWKLHWDMKWLVIDSVTWCHPYRNAFPRFLYYICTSNKTITAHYFQVRQSVISKYTKFCQRTKLLFLTLPKRTGSCTIKWPLISCLSLTIVFFSFVLSSYKTD